MEEIGIVDIKNLNRVLEEKYGYSFSDYAQSSFKRRIARILKLHHHDDIGALIKRLKNDHSYFDVFLDEITVNTTEMFRDPTFWKAVKERVLPSLESHQTIRIWHAGCSSGEEVFTMGILLEEAGLLGKSKIYATDISSTILDKAKKGIYPIRNMETNMMNYELCCGKTGLDKYYTGKGHNAIMDPRLVKSVTWMEQNLITLREPFMKFDIILCRNVMIYFSATLQAKIFKLFHDSLLGNGVLGIGSKESILWNNSASSFEAINNEERIYRKR